MSFNQLYLLAICELRFEYDLHPDMVAFLENNTQLRDQANFIYDQLICKQQALVKQYKDGFNSKINQLTRDAESDARCGFVTKCHANGFKEFCNLSRELHNKTKGQNHLFQKKNINHVIDERYQNDIHTIMNFVFELISFLINRLIDGYLIGNSQLITVGLEDHKQLGQYDRLVLEDGNYFRSNYLKNSNVYYYRLNQGDCCLA